MRHNMRIKYKAHPTKRPLAHLIPPPKPGRSLRTEAAVKSKNGRKFLDRFKSYFGSQISSQSLNEIYICRLQPKSATKGKGFFFIYFFVFHCLFESAHVAL